MAVFSLALAARMVRLFGGSLVPGRSGYDESVYYAAADALLHGVAPYRGDFVFVHPPVVTIVGLPFALLGRLTTAHTGSVVANVAFAVLGALTAALITVVAKRAGAPAWGALAAGVFYATWSVTVNAGSSMRLEPLGDLLLVTAVWLIGPGRDPSMRHLFLAGVVLGILVNVKLWWALPIALLILHTALRVRRRSVAVVPLAAAATALLIDLPFLLLAGRRMVSSIVTAQLGRPDIQATPDGTFDRLSTMVRLERLTGVEGVVVRFLGEPDGADGGATAVVVTIVVCVLVVLASVVALRSSPASSLARLFVPMLAAQVLVLLLTPIYFAFYGGYVGVPLAMVIAAAARPAGGQPRALPWGALWPAGAVLTLVVLLTESGPAAQPPDREALAEATRGIPCIVADTPKVLIELDALDRSFENGCRNWVDLQGLGHGAGPDPGARVRGPVATPEWRRTMVRYFRSGDAVVLSDPTVRFFLGPERVRSITSGPVVAESGGLVVHLVQRPVR